MSTQDQDIRMERVARSLEAIADALEAILELLRERPLTKKGKSR